MSDQNGLRFDIYERVHLSETGTGIYDLVEAELSPAIEVLSRGEQAVLKGNLLLTGKYVGEGENRETVDLEHYIPVEITLPMNRIQQLDDIQVEIDDFDIDLLSSRSLNVTGVLTLRGIKMIQEPAFNDQWEEEIVVVHPPEPSPTYADATQTAYNRTETDEFAKAQEADGEADMQQEMQMEVNPLGAHTPWEIQESDSGEFLEAATGQEEKKEMKVAFGANKNETAVEQQPVGLQTLLHKSVTSTETRGETEETDIYAASQPPSSTGDELEWKNLFLQTAKEEKEFRKLRMCIVQKEETINTIAERYNLNPREIILYNRLGEQQVSEGQVIYIPKA